MVAHIHFFDESANGVRSAGITLEVPVERITTRELIRRRVEHEVAVHAASADRRLFKGLVQPTGAEVTERGFVFAKARQLDPREQVRIALEAFERNGFFVLFDDRQLESLDEEVVLGADNDVAFIRLTPLVGG